MRIDDKIFCVLNRLREYMYKICFMKKLSLLIVTVLLFHTLQAQLQEESFASSRLPKGWKALNTTSSCNWEFGYTGVMPHSGPTIESEFNAGAVLFRDAGCAEGMRERISLTAPAMDLSENGGARIEVTYNLQVAEEKGEFTIEVYDGRAWQQIFFQDTSSPRNTGMNEMVSLDVSTYLNEDFQVKFTYDDEGADNGNSLAIAQYRLLDTPGEEAIGSMDASLGLTGYLSVSDNILVLDANSKLESIEAFHKFGEHLNEYEPNDTLYQAQSVPVSTSLFQVQGGELGSYKVLTP